MATYKHRAFLVENQDEIFDDVYEPGTLIFHSGIYRCLECGGEIATPERKVFPQCGHHPQNAAGQSHTLWRLIARANQGAR